MEELMAAAKLTLPQELELKKLEFALEKIDHESLKKLLRETTEYAMKQQNMARHLMKTVSTGEPFRI